MDAMDKQSDPDERARPSKELKSSKSMSPSHDGSTMEPSHSSPVGSVRPPTPMDVVESIRGIYDKIDQVEQIDPLITIVEDQLQRMNQTQSEAVCSSSEGWENRCRELLRIILQLAKDVKENSKERGKLCSAVRTLVEAAIICSDHTKTEKSSRFLSATTGATHEKTNQQISNGMDSPALTLLQRHWDKDVFLSHSGKQKNFVRQLNEDLKKEHVSRFFDEEDDSLPIGQEFPRLIFKAAESCKIAVVVLSKDFIRSKWPMLELSAFVKVMKSGKNDKLKIIPIFFKIEPNKVFDFLKDNPEWGKMEESDVEKSEWHDALREVKKMKGLRLLEDGNELDCRKKVVEEIRCFLSGIKPPMLLDFEPVGIEKQVDEVKVLLDMEGDQSALAVIVCGFGGMGKSTIGASVVQSLYRSSPEFKFCRVVIDESKPDKKSHIIQLQKHIINKLGGVDFDFQEPDEGRRKIKEAVQKKCSLLFIDNVVDKNYVRDLLPTNLSFSEEKASSGEEKTKLRIIITSRQINVKAELNIPCRQSYVKGLSDEASERLLSETILNGEELEDKDFDEKGMINKVAAACHGVPLLLAVFGKHLRAARDEDNYQDELKEALKALTEGNHENLSSYEEDLCPRLMFFVYNKIPKVEVKDAFLDICAYFNGWEWNLVADIVDLSTLKDLSRRMLVSSVSGQVIVHDILRLMGMQEARHTRFSNYKELSDTLEENSDSYGKVKGISLVNDNHLIVKIQSMQLEAMSQSLRVLMLGDWVTMGGPPCQKAFANLRYLRVGDITSFPFKDSSKLKNLRVFLNRSKGGMNLSHLPSSLKRISHEVPHVECDEFAKLPLQNLSCLESFIVKTPKSVELPRELHFPASLVDLDLSRCNNLPKDIGHLSALQSLILDYSHMECLPQGFGALRKLKHLSVVCCSQLAFLPEELGMLSSLQVLRMNGCVNLRALPESLGELPLRSLTLDLLVMLKELPNSFGNMPLLEKLSFINCHSLSSLPESFVQLKGLQSLTIKMCIKLSFLPKNFTELTSLEDLHLEDLPLLSRFPDGFGKVKNLSNLCVQRCSQLKMLSDDFENTATLESLIIEGCPELDGAMMEKILKLQQCYRARISGSSELVKKWKQMQSETEHPVRVLDGEYSEESQTETERAIRVALLQGKCMEVNSAAGQLIEHSSLLAVLEEGTSVTVAVIMLPIHFQSDQQQTLQRLVEMASETANTNGSDKLQIVCARIYLWTDQRRTPTEEEERADEEGIRQILKTLPDGSCAIPSSETKRVRVLSWCFHLSHLFHNKPILFTANKGLNIDGRKTYENLKFTQQNDFSGNVNIIEQPENYYSWENYIESLCPLSYKLKAANYYVESESLGHSHSERRAVGHSQSESVAGKSEPRLFMDALKGNAIDYLLTDNENNKVMVDDLHGKAIGFLICDFNLFRITKLPQIFKDLQQKHSNFIVIWIPIENGLPKDYGHGSYARLIQCRPWAFCPHPQLVNVEDKYENPYFLVLDEQGQIANQDALPMLLGWGVESYPFTQHTIPESFSLVKSESCLEFLLHGINIVGRKPMNKKMTFLYANDYSGDKHELEDKLQQLTQINGNFEVLYVGYFSQWPLPDTEKSKQDYENRLQEYDGLWASLSFSDTIMFWNRCKYLESEKMYELYKESNIMMEPLHRLAKYLWSHQLYNDRIVLVDNDGPVTRAALEVVQMIIDEISDGEELRMVKDELIKSLSSGECSQIVKTFFRDEIYNHPQHPQHPILLYPCWTVCSVCSNAIQYDGGRSYTCFKCSWFMCVSCSMEYAKQEVKQLMLSQK